MKDCRPLVMALLLLGGGCTAIVDAGSYEVLADGGGRERPDSAAGDADTGMLDADTSVPEPEPDAEAGPPADTGPTADADADSMVEETPVEVDYVKLEATVTALATWACVNVSRCESRLGGEAQRAGALAYCHPDAVRKVHFEPLRMSVEEGSVGFDAAKADGCMAALASSDEVDCGADLSAASVEACDGVFAGLTTDGEACRSDVQCAAGLVCAGNLPGCDGVCQPPGSQSDACLENSECEPRFACLDAKCVFRAGDGIPCDADSECLAGLYCAADGSCAARIEADEACIVTSNCVPDLLCVQNEAATASTCGEGVELGGDCSVQRPCALRSRCAGGRCVLVAKPGASCNSDAQCPSGMFCGSDGCEPKPILDQECDESAAARPRRECVEGVCVDGTCTLGAEAAACRFEPGSPFAACEGYCPASGMCASSTKIAGRSCEGDYECADGLLCLADDPAEPTMRICIRPQCGG